MERWPSRAVRLLLATAGTFLIACSGGANPNPPPSVPATAPAQSVQPAVSSTSEPELAPEVLTGVAPPVRFLMTTVWDPEAGRVLLYAGYDRTVRSELYSFDPATNRFELIAADGPPGRFAHTAIWNPDSSEMIVHGGASEGGRGVLSDTWAYRPADRAWRLLSTAGPGRAHAAAVWDTENHRMLLFAGTPGNYQDRDDGLWSFDPVSARWTKLSAPNGPPPRYNHTATWDPVRNRMLVFGGWTGFRTDPNYNDLWAYAPREGAWTRLATTPGGHPLGRLRHSAVWNTQADALWIFAGLGGGRLDDLWSYSPATDLWKLEAEGVVPGRDRHAAAWDPRLNAMLVFGGGSQTCFFLSDVWRYSHSPGEWTRIAAPKESARLYAHTAWIDQATDSLMTLGACDGDVGEGRVSTFNLETETWTAMQAPGIGEPAESASAWDPGSRKLYVHGGRNAAFGSKVLDAAAGTWSSLPGGVSQPPSLWGSASVWDTSRRRLLVYGGRANQYHSSVWAYDPASQNWSVASDGSKEGPGPRAQSTAVWIAETNEMVVFGGRWERPDNSGLDEYNDLWAFNSSTGSWRRMATSGPLPPRLSNATLVHPPGSDTILMFAGWNNVDVLVSSRLWSYSLSANRWTAIDVSGESPAARLFHTAVWDDTRGRMIVHGGYTPDGGVAGDVWAYTPSTNTWTKLGGGPHVVARPEPASGAATPPPNQGAATLPVDPGVPNPQPPIVTAPAGPSRVLGMVSYSDGRPAADVEVVACSAATPDPCPRTRSDAAGAFAIELDAGAYSVSFIPQGAPGPAVTVSMQTGISQDVALPGN